MRQILEMQMNSQKKNHRGKKFSMTICRERTKNSPHSINSMKQDGK